MNAAGLWTKSVLVSERNLRRGESRGFYCATYNVGIRERWKKGFSFSIVFVSACQKSSTYLKTFFIFGRRPHTRGFRIYKHKTVHVHTTSQFLHPYNHVGKILTAGEKTVFRSRSQGQGKGGGTFEWYNPSQWLRECGKIGVVLSVRENSKRWKMIPSFFQTIRKKVPFFVFCRISTSDFSKECGEPR